MNTKSIISEWAASNCEDMLGRQGLSMADFTFTEEPELDNWYLGHITVQAKRSKVTATYFVHDSHDWIAKLEEHLRTNYFGLTLRPRLKHKG